ncbi:hypothetical protein LOD99_13558 [Oopsacas minuta]|uniref:LisH domain-containing protein n=1 Tax=Oopsacas minuta TaxID=111878 RepID=A0AAV7KHM2_9METZ|nr:hypothetical protein LOD99_13558 [Oopsacas minuta]
MYYTTFYIQEFLRLQIVSQDYILLFTLYCRSFEQIYIMATHKQNVRKQQSREKLAEYVYEYLIFIGANSTAQSFVHEYIQPSWNKSLPSVADNRSFLISWWSIFWELFSSSTDHKLESPEGFEVNRTFQDLASTSLNSDTSSTDPHSFLTIPGTPLSIDSTLSRPQSITPQGVHTMVSPNLPQHYSLSPTSTYPTTMSTPTTWEATFPLSHAESISVPHSHMQCSPILDFILDSGLTNQEKVAIMKLKESFAKEAEQFEDHSSFPPNTFSDNAVP